jgi:monovalent cation:H+ antiporter-2, CPA2 family
VPHDTPLISIMAIGFVTAFLLGLLANRFKLPPIVGYLAAGILIGPFTPGFVADQHLATELAEIGVILLMFGVGLHFSLKDLMAVRFIAIPGAIVQIAAATAMGMGLSWAMGWSWGTGLLFGLSLSVASTVVLLRTLQEAHLIDTDRGKIAVGWLIAEDLVMVLILVLLPPLAGLLGGVTPATGTESYAAFLNMGPVWTTLLETIAKVALFVFLMLVIGRRLIPMLLHYVAHTGSRELFRLSVLAVAMGVAFASATIFGVSFALGAFFAGMVLAESTLSHQAAKETLPLRDAFAVLFFVSVGMLFNPAVLLEQPLAVLATFAIIVIGKSLAAYAVVRAFGRKHNVALTISASLAQIGEFSFILIVLGGKLEILPPVAGDLVVAGAILSILFNPLVFAAAARLSAAKPETEAASATGAAQTLSERGKTDGRVVLFGNGQVGSRISEKLLSANIPMVVIDADLSPLQPLKDKGVDVIVAASGDETIFRDLNLAAARCVVIAIPNTLEAANVIEMIRRDNPQIRIITKASNSDGEAYLRSVGADNVFISEEAMANSLFESIVR